MHTTRMTQAHPHRLYRRVQLHVLLTLAVAWWVAASPSVSATVLLPADFSTVVIGSGIIVHGRVVDVRAVLAGPRRTIESLVTMTVLDAIKGDPGSTITFRLPGGQVGRYRRVVVGAPEFAQGDEAVVFLRGNAPSVPTPVGLSQGVYRVMRDRDARAFVTPAPVMSRGAVPQRVVRGDPDRKPMTVDAFTREVEAILERGR